MIYQNLYLDIIELVSIREKWDFPLTINSIVINNEVWTQWYTHVGLITFLKRKRESFFFINKEQHVNLLSNINSRYKQQPWLSSYKMQLYI